MGDPSFYLFQLSFAQFLAKLKIMDYSLLIGLHTLPESDRSQLSPPSHLFEFYKDFDGFRSSFADNSNGPEVYYLGKQKHKDEDASFTYAL